jgi:hypothetical protein
MFRQTSSQRPLFAVENRLDAGKRTRLERGWGHQYRASALPLIDETLFARFFHENNGRPNKSVRLVVSVLIFKEMFDLTDDEALEQLEWNAMWHYALDVRPENAHACQKTLHNFQIFPIPRQRARCSTSRSATSSEPASTPMDSPAMRATPPA